MKYKFKNGGIVKLQGAGLVPILKKAAQQVQKIKLYPNKYWYVGHQTGSANFPSIQQFGLRTNSGLNGTATWVDQAFVDNFLNGQLKELGLSHEGADGLVLMAFPKDKFPGVRTLDDISFKLMELGESKNFEVPTQYLTFLTKKQNPLEITELKVPEIKLPDPPYMGEYALTPRESFDRFNATGRQRELFMKSHPVDLRMSDDWKPSWNEELANARRDFANKYAHQFDDAWNKRVEFNANIPEFGYSVGTIIGPRPEYYGRVQLSTDSSTDTPLARVVQSHEGGHATGNTNEVFIYKYLLKKNILDPSRLLPERRDYYFGPTGVDYGEPSAHLKELPDWLGLKVDSVGNYIDHSGKIHKINEQDIQNYVNFLRSYGWEKGDTIWDAINPDKMQDFLDFMNQHKLGLALPLISTAALGNIEQHKQGGILKFQNSGIISVLKKLFSTFKSSSKKVMELDKSFAGTPKVIEYVPKVTISEPYARVSRDLSTINTAQSFSIDGDPFNTFQLVKDIEPKQYSVHFKTLGRHALNENQKQMLFKAVADAVPGGSTLSTWGSVSKGGLAGLKRFTELGFKPTLQTRVLGLKMQPTVGEVFPFGELKADKIEVPVLYKPKFKQGGKI